MSVHPNLLSLNIDIPSQPQDLAELSMLLSEHEVPLHAVSALIERNMALAAAVLKAVNSSMYGLTSRVRSVHQAITFIGLREVAALTFEMGLKAVFPTAAELDPIWERATVRGLLMGRIGQALGVDPWGAHSAGLFEECGKPILYRHAPASYRGLLKQGLSDTELQEQEALAFGVSHDTLGAALCEHWGLAPAAVHSVRYHVSVSATGQLPQHVDRRAICAISALANALMTNPDTLDEVACTVAPQAQLDVEMTLRGVRKVQTQIEEAVARSANTPAARRGGGDRG